MAFNFGSFGGGFSTGFQNGVNMGKSLQQLARERGLQEIRDKGMAEAEAQRAQTVQDMVKQGGTTGEQQPTSGPVDTSTPKVETPPTDAAAVSASSPTANPDAAGANTAASSGAPVSPAAVSAASPTANPDAAAANTAASAQSGAAPSVSTQAPAPVQATPQGVAATGVAPRTKPAAPVEAPATPVQKPNGKFSVNGKSYDTREQALAAAEKAAPSATDMFMKNTVPKLAAQYVINGEPEKAKAWTDYADSVNGKRAIKDWAAAYTAPDFDTAATRFGKYYTEHVNDGVDYTGHKMLTKEDGTQVAVVTLKDKATGKTSELEMTREKMLALGGANNPQKLFETEQAKQAAAEKMKYEAKLRAQQRKDDYADKSRLESEKQDRIDEREAGKTTSKKTTDPTERRALIRSDEMKNNPKFARMSPEEQNKAIDAAMETVYGKDASKGDKPAAPVIVDKPMAYDKNLPVKYRKSDGKAFHINAKGEYVPIDGAVPTQPAAAGGLPQKK